MTLLPLGRAERFQVFETGAIDIAVGDRIRLTDNGRTTDNRHRLNNGRIYGIKAITGDGRLILDNNWEVPRNFGHIDHGYCVTSDASQGRTVDHVIVALSDTSMVAASMQQFYRSVTRGRFRISMFTDDVEKLLGSAARHASRLSATELVRMSTTPQLALHHRQSLGLWLSQQADRGKRLSANHQAPTATLAAPPAAAGPRPGCGGRVRA